MSDKMFAQFSFLVTVKTTDNAVLSDFSYAQEEKFLRNMSKKIMLSVAEYPDLLSIEVRPVALSTTRVSEEYVETDEESGSDDN